MAGVKRINQEEFEHRLDYLVHVAGIDLYDEITRGVASYNMAKAIETLRLISRSARECAVFAEELEAAEQAKANAESGKDETP